jgi:hypothetical protein
MTTNLSIDLPPATYPPAVSQDVTLGFAHDINKLSRVAIPRITDLQLTQIQGRRAPYFISPQQDPDIRANMIVGENAAQKINIIDSVGKNAMQRRYGNCFDITSVGYLFTIYAFERHSVEIFSIMNRPQDFDIPDRPETRIPHHFLVLDRDPASTPNNYQHWGDHAVICDPWVNAIYPAHDIPRRLYYLQKSIREHNGVVVVLPKWFNPEKQTLEKIV